MQKDRDLCSTLIDERVRKERFLREWMENIERHRENDWADTKDRETTRMRTWKSVEMLIEMQTVTTTVILDIDIESIPGEKEPKENCERPRMEPGKGESEIEWRRRSTSRLDYLVNSETWASSLLEGESKARTSWEGSLDLGLGAVDETPLQSWDPTNFWLRQLVECCRTEVNWIAITGRTAINHTCCLFSS